MATTQITDESLEAVKALAEAATSGRWSVSRGDDAASVRTPAGSLTWDDHGGEVFTAEDAAFIAATDPQFILDLIANRNYWKQQAADNLRMAEEQHAQALQG